MSTTSDRLDRLEAAVFPSPEDRAAAIATEHPSYRPRLLAQDVRTIEAEIRIREHEHPARNKDFILGYRAATDAAIEEINARWKFAKVLAAHHSDRVDTLDAHYRQALAIVDGDPDG